MANREVLYLFDRPAEPVYVPKGDEKVSFDIPQDYLPDRYQPVANDILSRFDNDADKKIPVKQIRIPDLSIPMEIGRRELFSTFIPFHRRAAARLIELFMGMRTYEDFLSLAVYCRDRLNPNLFIYALSVAILHRPDTQNVPLPAFSEIFPDKYMGKEVFTQAREEVNVVAAGNRIPIEIPSDYTASNLDPEHKVAYWREDIGINLHHWHWHLVYPIRANIEIVNKDRRGELFYYMHAQVMARYNTERLCNGMNRVERLTNLRDPIPQAYFPKLDSLVAGRTWPSRQSGAVLQDVNRPVDQVVIDVADVERWRDKIFDAISLGYAIQENGDRLTLDEVRGIDILGNMVEASMLTPNAKVYGDMHNYGHLLLAYCHDPDNRYLESFGIMGDSATAMRDPIFYRWHAFVDDIFNKFKEGLPPYSVPQLDFPGIRVTDVSIQSSGAKEPNVLSTFWMKSEVDLSRGLDFVPRGPILARFKHLNHVPYTIRLVVNNTSGSQKTGTARIFFAPKFDERGQEFKFRDMRRLMIELDKFTVQLRPGENVIQRSSVESNVTIPFEQTFRNLDANRPTTVSQLEAFNLCGCGWPQHMLIPRGIKSGFSMVLFAMISDFAGDQVDAQPTEGCKNAASYCGLKNTKYPDARAMGYPFDRSGRRGVATLQDFTTNNMAIKDCTISHQDVVRDNRRRPRSADSTKNCTGDEN